MSTPSTADLLDRRTALVERGAPRAELDASGEELSARLSAQQPTVRRITLDGDPELVDRLVAAEPVHPFGGPTDVADRLDEDRRCFVLEHPELPGRPLNVVWCALWSGIPGALAEILDPSAATADPLSADTAAFYSIWNVERGLVGLPGGRRLLVGAIAALRSELDRLRTFVTLSPVPGFRRWAGAVDLDPANEAELRACCARYLTSFGDDGRLLDPVARFHLGNGARLHGIRADADLSDRGLQRSWGLMANYRYEPEDRNANRNSLASGRPAVSERVAALVADCDGRVNQG